MVEATEAPLLWGRRFGVCDKTHIIRPLTELLIFVTIEDYFSVLMIQEHSSHTQGFEQRVMQMERNVAERLGSIDAGIQEAFGQVREGDFVRRVLRSEIQRVLEDEKNAEKEKREQNLQQQRKKRRRKIATLLAGVLLLGGASYIWKEHFQPDKSYSEFLRQTVDQVRQKTWEVVYPQELPPEEGYARIWASPEEQALILSRRRSKENLQKLMQELTEAQLQLEGWASQSDENSLREVSLDYWEKQVKTLQEQIRNTWTILGENLLKPPPQSAMNDQSPK